MPNVSLSIQYQWLVLMLFSLVGPVLFRMLLPRLARAIFGDLRLIRIFHYVTLAVLGAALYLQTQSSSVETVFCLPRFLQFVLLTLALTYAAVFAIVSNNFADIETDRLTNRNRPLVQMTVFRKEYLAAGLISLGWSLCLAYALSAFMLLALFAISLGYFLYSCRPFRLKRIPILAKLIIGFNSWVAALCGYVLMGGEVQHFPMLWMVFILVPLSLSANFIDLKDTEGDRLARVKTLPVLLGEKRARLFIAIATVATYGMASWILNLWFLYPVSGSMAALHLYFLYAKPYRERPVFLVYIFSIWSLIVILLFYNQLVAL